MTQRPDLSLLIDFNICSRNCKPCERVVLPLLQPEQHNEPGASGHYGFRSPQAHYAAFCIMMPCMVSLVTNTTVRVGKTTMIVREGAGEERYDVLCPPRPGPTKSIVDHSGLGNTALPIISVRRNLARIFLEDNYKFINLEDL